MGNNLIDRQVAIDALKEHRALYCDNTPDTFSKLSYAEKSRVDELDTAIATLVNLPSAQPELIAQGAYVRGFEQGRTQGMLDAKLEPTCNQLATDTISRQAAIDALHMHLMYRMGTDSNKKRLDDWINGLPSAQETHEERTETHACDLIDRQAAIDALWKALYEYEDKTEKQFIDSEELDVADWIQHRIFVQNMSDIDRQTIIGLPSAESERKTGRWERHYSRPNVYADLCWHCSNCGYKTPDNWANKWKFCPNCGSYNGGEL